MPELQKFAESIWIIDGPPVRAVVVPLPTRMVIVQLSDGSLWVNSPVSVSVQMLDRITALGPVRYLVAPTKLHIWRLEEWHALFPEAELWLPPHNPKKSKGLPFSGILDGTQPRTWMGDLDQLVFNGNLFLQEVFFLHKPSHTLMVADFVMNLPIKTGKPMLNAVWKIEGVAYPNGGVPLEARLSFTDRKLARQCLEKLFSWDFDKLIIAHGVCLEKDAKRFVKRAFRWLVR